MADPKTPEEWQEAVDAAHACLFFYSSREEHGLIEGGPKINVERCEDLLTRGAELGYEPNEDAPLIYAYGLREEYPDLRVSHHFERIEAVRKFAGRSMS